MERRIDPLNASGEPAPGARTPASVENTPARPRRRMHWVWPLGVALAGAGSAAAYLLRGCWHTHMSWPVSVDDEFSYQVCTSCGIKRLYDAKGFHAFGPFGYDVHELIARERAARLRRRRLQEEVLKRRQAQAAKEPR
jgi:hypothetical protein